MADLDFKDVWGINSVTHGDVVNDIPAFFNIEDLDDDELVKKDLETRITTLKSQMQGFTSKCVENLMFVKGVQAQRYKDYNSLEDAHRFVRDNTISFNIVYEFVELWVNRVASFKAEVSVTPTTNDSEARDNAEAKELALKDFFHKNKIDLIFNEASRQSFTFGESYIYLSWDQDRGALHPAFEEIEKKYKGLKRVSTASGEEVNINRLPRIGDVKIQVVPPIYLLKEDRPWDETEYLILELKEHVDKVRSDYPDIDIEGSGDIPVFTMLHLPTKYLPKGRFVKFAAGEVLENTDYPYARPIFPIVRLSDIDIIGSGRGKSFVEYIKPHQVLINESISATYNNLRRTAKGKWVTPAKTVNPRHLAPESPAIEYYGSIPPQFITYPGIKSEALNFISLLREYAEKQARVHGIVQGTPPPNIRSGLQFAQLEEQEKRSSEIVISKKYTAIEEVGEVAALIMSTYYRPEDQRTITLFGKDKEYLTQAINLSALKEDHPVRVKSEDGIPTGKVSQMAFFSDLREKFGNEVVPDEMMIDMLDSGRFNQYTEFGGATIETTLFQVSQMVKGEVPEPPQEYEDLILKWKIVVGTMRKRAFLSYSEDVKQVFEDMVYTIEDLIINKVNQTPALQERIQTLQSFPIYYKPSTLEFAPQEIPMPASPEEEAMMAEEAMMEEAPEMVEDIPDGVEEVPMEEML